MKWDLKEGKNNFSRTGPHPWHGLVLWAWIGLQYFNFVPTQNEENYFALAKQFFQPGWAPWSFSLTEFPGTRLLFQYLAGFFLQFTSFENFAFFSRCIGYALILLPLNSLLDKWNFSLLLKLCILQLFIYYDQAYFAGGWIFEGFEAKSLSLIFAFFALNAVVRERFVLAFILAAAATWFHILVGGWFTLALGIYLLLEKRSPREILFSAGAWVLITAPFVWYLASGILVHSGSVVSGVNIDEIYVFFRNPHHTGIYRPLSRFAALHLPGVVALVISLAVALYFKGGEIRKLRLLFLAFAGLTLFNLIAGSFDRHGAFLKFYPFRPAVFALLLFIMLAAAWLQRNMVAVYFRRVAVLVFLLMVIPSFLQKVRHNIQVQQKGVISAERAELFQACREVSQEGDVFLFLDYLQWDTDLSFIRNTGRDRFFVYKFVPGGGEKIYNWYQRYLYKERVLGDITVLQSDPRYDIDFIVSSQSLSQPFLQLVQQQGGYYIYRCDLRKEEL